jgi:amino-acid N-acetyltransferase
MEIRPARTGDVRVIRELIDQYAPDRRLLSKATVTLYEDVTDFFVADDDGAVVGCGALHVMWEDLAEVRTLAVLPHMLRRGIGSALLAALVRRARDVGVSRVFCLTFETEFFAAFGFDELRERGVESRVYEELLRSPDEGVAEFLDLERVRPNTLGNTRMVLQL